MRDFDISFSSRWERIRTIEMHTGGEPLRIVVSGLPEIPGKSIPEKIQYFKDNFDHLRKRLVWEPRGHADMYAAVLTEAVHPDSDFGVFFLHNEGYSSMCGHAILALTTLMAKSEPPEDNGTKTFQIDVPSGIVKAYAEFRDGQLLQVYFDNVPSFVVEKAATIELKDYGSIKLDIAFGGAFYAYVNAEQLQLEIKAKNSSALIHLGRLIKKKVQQHFATDHPFDPLLSFLYGVIFYEPGSNSNYESRNACIFADGELDRSPTGTGVSGKAAILHSEGKMKPGDRVHIQSIIGSEMEVSIIEELTFGPYEAIVPRVGGKAYLTGFNTLLFDKKDPFVDGFFIR